MGIWTVWENARHGEAAPLKARFVKDSFSWAAFLFAPFWLLANGMVAAFVALAVVAAAAGFAAQHFGLAPEAVAAGGAVALLWFGFEARGLRRWSLARRGWAMTAVVEARRFRNAERRYLETRVAPTSAPAPAPASASAPVRRPSPLPAVPATAVPPLPPSPPPLPGEPL